ncbi:DUF6916 family protein [Tritonibacter mobilis]|uniref:DUF6916 domain-containing protein n=1 Tax=Tritonibacter mobilis F1926 TaxID=1265309 RepID=A0A1B1A6X5_9RHOB|nr:hypothetical protein [Tritonibacter mobilis]ANP42286.1 hypothetical protein K529_016020 [Tritonibacter mobilis F1926]KJZ22619.1 hypothetical protein TW79_17700 [Tritonibacter mobilis]
MTTLHSLTSTDFEALLDRAFEVRSVSEDVHLSLIEVKAMGSGAREGGAFSTLWQGPRSPILEQATYRLFEEEFGEQEVFLVPVAEKDAGIQYEAVFT